jgi:hypothetical protein
LEQAFLDRRSAVPARDIALVRGATTALIIDDPGGPTLHAEGALARRLARALGERQPFHCRRWVGKKPSAGRPALESILMPPRTNLDVVATR